MPKPATHLGSTVASLARLVCLVGLSACGVHEPPKAGPVAGVNGGAGAAGLGQAGTLGVAGTDGAGSGGVAGTLGTAGTSSSTAGSGAGNGGAECVVGDKHYPDGATNIPAADGCNHCFCANGQLGCTLIGCVDDPTECKLARRLDACCETYEPHTQGEIDSEECLVPYGAPVDADLANRCLKQSNIDCTAAFCGVTPYSHVVIKSASGECVFTDECNAEASCVLATDVTQCCSCPVSLPASFVDAEPCLVKQGEATPGPEVCEPCKLPVLCGQCAEAKEPHCEVRDSFSLCR